MTFVIRIGNKRFPIGDLDSRERQQAPHPRVDADTVRDYLTYLAVRQQVSARTQNQALCALLFLCREVLGLDVGDLTTTARAKRGPRRPTVLGHTNVGTTMIYTDVVKDLRTPPRSPLNLLQSGGH
jgi:hypothetical protein